MADDGGGLLIALTSRPAARQIPASFPEEANMIRRGLLLAWLARSRVVPMDPPIAETRHIVADARSTLAHAN